LTVARLHAAEAYDDIVTALAETQPRPLAVVLMLREADGALRLVAHRGLTPEVASQWGRIPPQVQVPLTDAVRDGEPVWLADPETAARRYPIIEAIGSRPGSTAALPLVAAGRVVGVLSLTWAEPGLGGPDSHAFLAALGEVCGPVAVRIATSDGLPGTDDSWLRPMLDAVLGSAAVLTPVRDGDRVIDFAFEFLNGRASADAERIGVRPGRDLLLTELPGPGTVLLPIYREVLADGKPRQLDELLLASAQPGEPGASLLLRAERLGGRVVASWRIRSPGELLYDDLVASERVAGVASFRWRPWAGRWLASPGLAELLDWPRGEAPPSPATALRAVVDVHWTAVRRAAVTALRGGRPPMVTVTTRRGRWLRLTLAPLPEGDGLRGTLQDVSELRAALSRQHGQALARAANRR
jgi:hypothetical protein